MTATPALRLAVMNDLHVGGPEGGGFQNTFLTTDAAALLAPTVAAINATDPGLVLIPGDLTHDATTDQLSTVLACLNDLDCPFVACRGNHDRETPEAAGRFDRMVGNAARPGVITGSGINLPDGVAVLVLESSWQKAGQPYVPGHPPLAVLDEGVAQQAFADLDRLRPEWLLVVSHYPLISQAGYVDVMEGRYAGHVEGGEDLLRELAARAGAVVAFCGHNHYHHILSGGRWLQCSTAALAEYPAEFRSVLIEDGCMTVSTATGAHDLLQRSPAPQHPWVRGRDEDREITWRPGEQMPAFPAHR